MTVLRFEQSRLCKAELHAVHLQPLSASHSIRVHSVDEACEMLDGGVVGNAMRLTQPSYQANGHAHM